MTEHLKQIKENLKIVLEDVERASNAHSDEAFDICQGLENVSLLLSDTIEEFDKIKKII